MYIGQLSSEAERLEASLCGSGLGKKYESVLKKGSVEPKKKGKIALSGPRLLLVRSYLQTLTHQLLAR